MDAVKIIVNPVTGRGAGDRAIARIEPVLGGYDLEFGLLRTARPWHAAGSAQMEILARRLGVLLPRPDPEALAEGGAE